jgi:hypothetical protein
VAPSRFDILTKIAPAAKRLTEDDGLRRPVTIGIICTILFHLLLLLGAPFLPIEKFGGDHSNLAAIAARKNKTFEFQLEPLPPTPPKPDPFKYVETNPDAPANEPDKTNNFSNRNQQSAQPEAAKEKDPENTPSTKGRDEIKDSNAVVSGDHSKPQQGAAVTPSSSQSEEQQQQPPQQARMEQVPLTGFDKTEGKSPDGVGTTNTQTPTPTNNAPQFIEGAKDAKAIDGATTASHAQTNKPQPKPRPRLTAARSTVLANRPAGTTNVGVLGIDARWSEYGDYMNELVEIVDAEWHGIVDETNIHVKPGTHVTVTFRLNSKGEVTVQSVEKDPSDADQVIVSQCTSGISNRQPYRKWTEQMISVLGQEQTIVFGFYYY